MSDKNAKRDSRPIKCLFFSYSLRLREARVRERDPVCALERFSNIKIDWWVPGSEAFDPALAEQSAMTPGAITSLPVMEANPEDVLQYHYVSQRLSAWDRFYTPHSMSGESFCEKQNKYKYYLSVFYAYLKREQPDFVLFGIDPHLGLDYVFYQAAQRTGIPVLIIHQSLQLRAIMILDTIERMGDMLSLPDYPYQNDVEFPLANEPMEWYYMSAPPRATKEANEDFRASHSGLAERVKAWIRKGYRRHRRLFGLKYLVDWNRAADKRARKAFEAAQARSVRVKLPLDQPFVYFALHLQPEATSAPQAGRYVDQLDAVCRIRELLPNEVAIIVKENPKQTHLMRDYWFFKRLEAIPNTYYAAGIVDTNLLIDKSLFTSTLLGSTAWESVCRLKPSLVFGHAWYTPVPGIFSIDDGPNYDEIVNCKFTLADVNRVRLALSRKLIPGTTDPGMALSLPEDERQENYRSIARGICWYLEHYHGLDGVEFTG